MRIIFKISSDSLKFKGITDLFSAHDKFFILCRVIYLKNIDKVHEKMVMIKNQSFLVGF